MSFIKKAVKGVVKFVKKHWKAIVIAAAVVFTAGIATVGFAGFSTAMGTAGGGIGGFLAAAGHTMVAGVASIGGTLGIGNGASLAGFGGAGSATLLNGAAAQSIGLAGVGASQTAGAIAAQAAAPAAAGVTTASGLTYGTGAGLSAAGVAPAASSFGIPLAGSAPVGAAGGGSSIAAGIGSEVVKDGAPAAGKGFLGLLTSQAGSSLLSAGIMGLNGYMQAKAANAAIDAQMPDASYGVALDGGKSMTPDDIRAANAGIGYDPHSFDRPHGTQGTATNGPIFGGN